MSDIAANITLTKPSAGRSLGLPFGVSFVSFCLIAALLISWKPLQLAIATVFLFAGPHNWIEFRYFVARMPARWGRSKPFFVIALGGVAALTTLYVLLYALGQSWYLSERVWTIGIAAWNTAVINWIGVLFYMRGRETRRADRSWVFAVGFALSACVWLVPIWFSLALVYLHPLIALWFLDRQLKRTRPAWRRAYHVSLALVPLIVAVMWTQLAGASNLPDEDALAWRITQHAGAGILSGVSSHFLVATHVLLETIHYGAWLVMIPLIGLRGRLWETKKIPLVAHRDGWPRAIRTVLVLGVCAMVVLWGGFAMDYATARDIYFTFAMAHVLAEAPFLIRLF